MKGSSGSEINGDRRRAPRATPLDARINNSYKGKLIKKRIERNQASKIRRKYFKSIKDKDDDNSNSPAVVGSGSKWKDHRSNPYHKLLKEKDLAKQRKEEERKQEEEEFKETQERREKYAQHRKTQHKKFTARTPRGQPVLSKQIGSLLDRIKKDQ